MFSQNGLFVLLEDDGFPQLKSLGTRRFSDTKTRAAQLKTLFWTARPIASVIFYFLNVNLWTYANEIEWPFRGLTFNIVHMDCAIDIETASLQSIHIV